MNIVLKFEIPKAFWWSQNRRGNWRAQYVRTNAVKQAAHLAATSWKHELANQTSWHALQRAEYPLHVTAVIHPRTYGRFDPENAAPMVKSILDALTHAGYWRDDNSHYILGPDYRAGERSTKKNTYQIDIHIEFHERGEQ